MWEQGKFYQWVIITLELITFKLDCIKLLPTVLIKLTRIFHLRFLLQKLWMLLLKRIQPICLLILPRLVWSHYINLNFHLCFHIFQLTPRLNQLILRLPPLLVQLTMIHLLIMWVLRLAQLLVQLNYAFICFLLVLFQSVNHVQLLNFLFGFFIAPHIIRHLIKLIAFLQSCFPFFLQFSHFSHQFLLFSLQVHIFLNKFVEIAFELQQLTSLTN